MIAQHAELASTSVLLKQSLKAKFIKLIRILAQIVGHVQMFARLRQSTRNNSVNHKIKKAAPLKCGFFYVRSEFLNLREFVITDTELKLIASAAIMGERSIPKKGYNNPAAMGIPSIL